MERFGLWIRSVRHLEARQIWHRGRLTLRRRLWERRPERIDRAYRMQAARVGGPRWDHAGLTQVAALRLERRSHEARLATAGDALEGRFRFLERTEEMGKDVPWHRPDLDLGTRLWKTHLHEFSYALDLAFAERTRGTGAYARRLFDLVESWRRASPIGGPGFALDSWNARAVATRLGNLALAGSLLGLRSGEARADALGRLLAEHALFLRDNLELDVRANHLMRDAVGLVFAAELLPDQPDPLPLLRAQLDEQILADGCHYERVPLYHAIVLEDLLEIALLLGDRSPDWLDRTVARMTGFLEDILLGDEDFPLLGDCWLGEIDVAHVRSSARRALADRATVSKPPDDDRPSGLVSLRRGAVRAVLRAGPHGPDNQLGHAHADLLSFDLSLGPQRVVTDTGTHSYDPGLRRDRLRSTAAHNTVQIDGEEQLEAWGSFRVGRRGRAQLEARGGDADWQWAWASHGAYGHLDGAPRHHRLLAVSSRILVVLDAITGRGSHRLVSNLHLHPDLHMDCVRVIPIGFQALASEAPFHGRFGEERPMPKWSAELETTLPWTGGWLLDTTPAASPDLQLERQATGIRIRYTNDGWSCDARWDFANPDDASSVGLRLCDPGGGSAI